MFVRVTTLVLLCVSVLAADSRPHTGRANRLCQGYGGPPELYAKAEALRYEQAPAPSGAERVASVEGITEYRLPNGLRVLLFPDQTKSTITVNVTYLAGSRHENYGETGMAHIIEHLVSYGSPKHPDAKAEQQERGARRNATTSVDRTNYYETFPASDENLEWALDLEADRMINAFVKKDILDSQMSVVRNEMEAGENNPLAVLSQRVLSTAFLWHNYGKSTIGARSDVEQVPIDRLLAFYKKYYQPDNAVLIVTGKFDEAAALKVVAAKFGPIPRPTRVLDRTYTSEPPQDGERTVTVQRVGDVQALFIAYHIPAMAHPDYGPLDLLTQVLASNPSGRLHKALVESKKAASVQGGNRGMLERGVLTLLAIVRKESSIDDTRTTAFATIDSLASTPPTAEEVDRVRSDMMRQMDLALSDSELVSSLLSGSSASGDWRLWFLHRDRLRKATVEDVRRVAGTYMKSANRTVGTFLPVASPVATDIPRTPDVMTMVKDYKGERDTAAGEAFDPSPTNIEARTVRGDLAPGLKLALLPKKTRGGTVHAALRLNYGDETSLKNLSIPADLVRGMLSRGTTKRTRQQIRDEMNRLRVNGNVSGTGGFTDATIQTTRASLVDALRLAAEMLREPAFPEAEFEQLRQERLAQAETIRREPQVMSAITLTRHMNPYQKGDVRYVYSADEQIAELKAVTLDQVKRFHKDFYGASHAELVIVGDFEPDEIRKVTTELFGGWKSPKPFADVRRTYQDVRPINESLEAPEKANASVSAGVRLRLNDEHKDYPALVLANYMLGGHSTSRLYNRIRAKEGLSYGVGSQLSVQPGGESADLMLGAITAPQNAAKVEAALKEELERALKDGFTADEVASAKKGWLQAQDVSRSQDPELVNRLRAQRHYGRTMAFDIDLQKKIAALTPEEITAALRRHLTVSQLSIVKAGDFKKTP